MKIIISLGWSNFFLYVFILSIFNIVFQFRYFYSFSSMFPFQLLFYFTITFILTSSSVNNM